MQLIKKGFQMNGVSIGGGAVAFALGFATLMVGIGKQNLIVIGVSVFLVVFAVFLVLSKTGVYLDSEKNQLRFVYRNLFQKKVSEHLLSESDYITFEQTSKSKTVSTRGLPFDSISVTWYPVKSSDYYVVLMTETGKSIILEECIDLKESFQVSKFYSKQLGIVFHSPLK
ncbi:MAG: hypothetical protein ACK476_03355 [Fluviicola sp.]|jgi:hypothetical protein